MMVLECYKHHCSYSILMVDQKLFFFYQFQEADLMVELNNKNTESLATFERQILSKGMCFTCVSSQKGFFKHFVRPRICFLNVETKLMQILFFSGCAFHWATAIAECSKH